jgi:energy-coupling factor transporter ATP-binding protein EcfA2/energy-coupling factor transporter transmembrane protein EcfT
LDTVDCEFPKGSVTLLIGQTGTGKSTLLEVLAGLIPPDKGEVRYDGASIWRPSTRIGFKNGKTMKRKPGVLLRTGLVFQNPEQQLFAKDVLAEFAYSLRPYCVQKEEIQERAKQSLQEVGLDEDILPQSPFSLSVGQRRRVALATVLATEVDWLFLDEPTSGLDPVATHMLIERLQEWKQSTLGGIVIATHDLDAFFPIADQVILMQEGKIVRSGTPKELLADPDLLIQAGIGLPSSLSVRKVCEHMGIRLPADLLTPEQVADAIVQHIHIGRTTVPRQLDREWGHQRTMNVEDPSAIPIEEMAGPIPFIQDWIRKLDPRSKWVFYLLSSIGILAQNSWFGLVLGLFFTVSLVLLSGMSLRQLGRASKPFLFFLLLSTVISGLQFGGSHSLYFSAAAGNNTLKHLFPVLLVLWLGLLLPFTTTQSELKYGLETACSGLRRFGVPVEALALAASLLFRFVTVIRSEIARFSKMTQARGKRDGKPGTLAFRDLPVALIPLLISLIQFAENLSVAMEARGYRKTDQKRTSCIQLRFTNQDWLVVGLGALVMGLFMGVRLWFG